MKIKAKLPLFTSVTVLVSIVVIALYSILDFRKKTLESIKSYKEEQTEIIKQELKDYVNNAYAMIKQAHELSAASLNPEKNKKIDQSELIARSQYLFLTKENIRQIRFGANGYIWLNEYEKPYTVIMHPIKPEMEGTIQTFLIPATQQNVYEAFAETIRDGGGEGFLQYDFYKPGSDVKIPKLSFIKLYQPLGWVIGTGVYIDHIDNIVARKTEELNTQINKIISYILLIGFVLITITTLSLYFFGKTITDAISQVRNQLFDMSKGRIINKSPETRQDEIGDMTASLNALIDGVNSYEQFALSIGKGNLNADFTTLSDEDNLGNSLLKMRESLVNAKTEEENRRNENEKRNWANEGYTKFSELMRVTRENINEIAYAVISNLVKYVDAIQGGIFIYNNDDPQNDYLELAASIAYQRRKYIEKIIKPGDGLVGTCALEKKRIYMTHVPDNYIEIRSGLGTANPKAILIVPLLSETNLIGIIELAGFKDFEEYQIEFIEKVSESIAASLFSAKINTQNLKLAEEYEKLRAENKRLEQLLQNKNTETDKLQNKQFNSQKENSILQLN
jgi:hypothetical protein